MLRLLIDTSVWLDMAKLRNGQKWIVAIRQSVMEGHIQLLVPHLVIDEFTRNQAGNAKAMTATVRESIRNTRRALSSFGTDADLATIDVWSQDIPLIGAMAARNFDDVLKMMQDHGATLEPNTEIEANIVHRGLEKLAPFHQGRNSVADALLIELYGAAVARADFRFDEYGFASSNFKDFSDPTDMRLAHPSFAPYFDDPKSHYAVGVDGLGDLMTTVLGQNFVDLLDESDFQSEPRSLEEIQTAEEEQSDRLWYHRSQRQFSDPQLGFREGTSQSLIDSTRQHIVDLEAKYGKASLENLSEFQLGLISGKMSALQWVLGSEWDLLDR